MTINREKDKCFTIESLHPTTLARCFSLSSNQACQINEVIFVLLCCINFVFTAFLFYCNQLRNNCIKVFAFSFID